MATAQTEPDPAPATPRRVPRVGDIVLYGSPNATTRSLETTVNGATPMAAVVTGLLHHLHPERGVSLTVFNPGLRIVEHIGRAFHAPELTPYCWSWRPEDNG